MYLVFLVSVFVHWLYLYYLQNDDQKKYDESALKLILVRNLLRIMNLDLSVLMVYIELLNHYMKYDNYIHILIYIHKKKVNFFSHLKKKKSLYYHYQYNVRLVLLFPITTCHSNHNRQVLEKSFLERYDILLQKAFLRGQIYYPQQQLTDSQHLFVFFKVVKIKCGKKSE